MVAVPADDVVDAVPSVMVSVPMARVPLRAVAEVDAEDRASVPIVVALAVPAAVGVPVRESELVTPEPYIIGSWVLTVAAVSVITVPAELTEAVIPLVALLVSTWVLM
jgi:hypothetical protein